MHTSLQGNEPGLVAYSRFDECLGAMAHDSSPEGVLMNLGAGTTASMPTWVPWDAPVN